MTVGNGGTILRHIHSIASTHAIRDLSDGKLLERFVAGRDESTFAVLMQRHGPLVWRVCRSILHGEQDAEDAFQATFMILVRRAGAIRKGESVGSWLYGVAYRVAMRARKNASTRAERARPAAAAAREQTLREVALRDLQAVLNGEIQRLPEKYRAPFVLCCLEGRGRREAAHELGWKEGTVSSRIAQARELLRNRLAQRGVVLTAALCAMNLAGIAKARVVPSATVRSILASAAAGGSASGPAAALADAVVASMCAATRLKTMAGLLALCLLAAATGAGAQQVLSPKPQTVAPPDSSQHGQLASAESVKRPGTDLFGDPLPEGATQRLGTIQRRAVGAKLAITADGKTIVGVREGKYVSLWDPESGSLRKTQILPTEHRGLWVLSPLGRWLVTDGTPDGTLALWDLETGKAVHQFAIKGAHQIFPVAFSPDEKLLGALAQIGNERSILVWDVATKKEVFAKPFATNVWSDQLAFSPDGKRLLVSFGSDDLGMFCWDIATAKQLWQNKQFRPPSMVIAPDGRIYSSVHTQPVLDLATGEPVELAVKPPGSRLNDSRLTLTPDGRTLLISTEKGLVIWELAATKFRLIPGAGEEVVVFPDGETVLTNSGMLQRWDLATGKALWPNNFDDGHAGEVTALAFSADGRTLVSGSLDGSVRLWDATTGKPLHVWRAQTAQRPPIGLMALAKGGVTALDISRDGRRVVSAGSIWNVELWDVRAGKRERALPFGQPQSGQSYLWPFDLRISPDGNRAVVLFGGHSGPDETSRHHLATWDMKTGQLLQHVQILQTDAVSPVSGAISPDALTLISKGALFDAATGKELVRLQGVDSSLDAPYTFSLDSALVGGGGRHTFPNDRRFGNGLSVWEAITGKKIAHLQSPWWVAQIAFHPGGRFVAGNDSEGIRIWDLSTGKVVATVSPPDKVRSRLTNSDPGTLSSCLTFSPDGRFLVTGQPDGTILLWRFAPPVVASVAPTPKELEQLWGELMETDAGRAWRAIWQLSDVPQATLSLLRERLKPRLPAPESVTAPLLADLNSDSFEHRDRAARTLKELGHAAEPALQQALKASASPEQKRRIEQALGELSLSPFELRELRALIVLSRIQSGDARRLLGELATGPESAPLTRYARILHQSH
jgi:RNA polymerase sigma factor (sigma-70 family)